MKTVKKIFFVWNSKEERDFLEQKAKEGYRLVDVKFGKYIFQEEDPKNIIYQFDFKGLGKIPEDEYISFYIDTGWILACKYGGWYYFYKEIKEGESIPSIYSDNNSKKSKYKRLLGFLLLTGFPLYYQNIVMFPNMESSKLEFPKFYFFFRIIVIIVTILHLFALIKVYTIYHKISKDLKE